MNWKMALALLVWAPPLAAWGSGFHSAEFHAAQVGQATGGSTLAENAGAVATMPAGLVRLAEGFHVLGGVVQVEANFSYQASDGTGPSTDTITEPVLGPHLYGVMNRRQWAVGFGQYFPFNVDTEWPEDWAGRALLTQEILTVGYSSVVGAYALNDQFSVGGGVNVIDAWLNLKQKQTEVAPGGKEFNSELGGTGSALGWILSALYVTEGWSAGFTHQPAYTIEGEGNARFDTSQFPGLTGQFPDGGVKVDLLMPSVTEVAVSYHSSANDPDVFAEFAVVRTGWSNFRELRIRFDKQLPVPVLLQERAWKDTTGYKLAGSYVVSRGGTTSHRVRGGLYLDESPIPQENLEPGVPDGKGRQEWAVGYGYRKGSFLLDAAYFFVDILPSESTNEDLPAKYDGDIQIIALSAGYGW